MEMAGNIYQGIDTYFSLVDPHFHSRVYLLVDTSADRVGHKKQCSYVRNIYKPDLVTSDAISSGGKTE